MARFTNIDAHLTPELRAQRHDMLERRGLPTLGFYEQLMAYPALFQHLQALGSFVRFESALAPRIREVEVLMVAVELRSEFEWQTHAKSAAAAGVEPALFDAVGHGAPLDAFGPALEDLREAVRCVVRQQSVPQDLFERLIATFTAEGAVEVIVLAAMYRMFASLGAAFDSRMPATTPPPPWV